MTDKTQKKFKRNEQLSDQSVYLFCHECGRTVRADACSWEEDDEGRIYCQECCAERDSCGCSD